MTSHVRWWPDLVFIEMDNALSPGRRHAIICSNTDIFANSLAPCDAYMHQWSYYHWFRWWLVVWLAPGHCLNQCWNVVGQAFGDTLPRGFNWNCTSSLKKYGRMAAIWSRSQCVNSTFKDLLEWKFTLNKNTPLTKMRLKMSCKMSAILSLSHVLITPAINSKMHTYCKALISERHFFLW